MEEIYYVGDCPICLEYGRLEIDKDVTNDKYFVMCEECCAEWKTPQEAFQNINGRRVPYYGAVVRSATWDEIKEIGWDKFVINL